MQNLGVIVDGLVETTVVALYHIVHKLLYGFLLAFQLHEVSNTYLSQQSFKKIIFQELGVWQ